MYVVYFRDSGVHHGRAKGEVRLALGIHIIIVLLYYESPRTRYNVLPVNKNIYQESYLLRSIFILYDNNLMEKFISELRVNKELYYTLRQQSKNHVQCTSGPRGGTELELELGLGLRHRETHLRLKAVVAAPPMPNARRGG